MTTAPLTLDDLVPGQTFRTGDHTVTEADIVAFAHQWDPQAFHLDAEAARASVFGGLAASGWHTAAITMRLLVTGGPALAWGLIGAGLEELRWLLPVRPGDTLTAEVEVVEVRPSASKPDRGIVRLAVATRNQTGATVMRFTAPMLVPRRATVCER